jgi:hypothetical protein
MMLHMFLGIIVVLNVSLQPNDRLDNEFILSLHRFTQFLRYIFIYTSTFDIFKLELSFFVLFVYVILTYVFAVMIYR